MMTADADCCRLSQTDHPQSDSWKSLVDRPTQLICIWIFICWWTDKRQKTQQGNLFINFQTNLKVKVSLAKKQAPFRGRGPPPLRAATLHRPTHCRQIGSSSFPCWKVEVHASATNVFLKAPKERIWWDLPIACKSGQLWKKREKHGIINPILKERIFKIIRKFCVEPYIS